MSTPVSYHLQRTPGAGTNILSFTAASDANAETVAQQMATILGINLWLVRTDSEAQPGSSPYVPAAQGGSLGNSVTNVLWSAY